MFEQTVLKSECGHSEILRTVTETDGYLGQKMGSSDFFSLIANIIVML